MNKEKEINKKRDRRAGRTRQAVRGTKPRLSVFRSNKYIYAQLIDDKQGVTVAAASSREIKNVKGKTQQAAQVGEMVAVRAKEKGVAQAVFDRGSYKYHGRVKAVAEGARQSGLNF